MVTIGWLSGFLIAVAWGATRADNPRLASTLSGWAIAGLVVTAVLLVSTALSDRARRRRVAREWRRQTRAASTAAAATAAEQRTAALIADLEARLAHEQEELDAAVASLATTELAATGHVSAGVIDQVPEADAVALEPALRQEVLDTVAELVGRGEPGETAALAGHLEEIIGRAQ